MTGVLATLARLLLFGMANVPSGYCDGDHSQFVTKSGLKVQALTHADEGCSRS